MPIKIGDEVICIFPGDGTGPDCKVGSRFIVLDIIKTTYHKEKGKSLVFNCHPYMDYLIIHPAARAWRFVEVKDIDAFTKMHTKVFIKERLK